MSLSQNSSKTSHVVNPHQQSDRHLRSLIKKLEDDLNEYENKFSRYSKRAKYEFKSKFEQFQSYLSIYISTKRNFNHSEQTIFQQYISQDHLQFPPIEITDLIVNYKKNQPAYIMNSSDQKNQKNNHVGTLDQSIQFQSQIQSPLKAPTSYRQSMKIRSGSKDNSNNKLYMQNNDNHLQPQGPIIISDSKQNNFTYREEFFLQKLKKLKISLKDSINGPNQITQYFDNNPVYQRKIKQLDLIMQQNKSIKFEHFTYQQVKNKFQSDKDSEFYFFDSLSQQNLDYLQLFNTRKDTIYFIHFQEENVQKLRVGYTDDLKKTIEYELLPNLKEFSILNIYGGNKYDEQQFHDFMNIYLLKLKTGSDFVIHTQREHGFYYSEDIVQFVQQWFVLQIEGNKQLMCPVYNLVRREEYEKIQEEVQRLQGIIQERDNEISQLNNIIQSRDTKIKQLEENLENCQNEIQQLKEEVEQRGDQIQDKEKIIEYQENVLKERQDRIEQKETELKNLRETYDLKNQEFDELANENKELMKKLEKITKNDEEDFEI